MKEVTKKYINASEDNLLGRAFVDRSRKTTSAVLEEKRKLVSEFNGNTTAAYLYDYYMNICQIPTWDLTNDAKIGKQLGLTTRKVGDTRRALTKAGWIRFDVHTYKGVRYALWYIGKDLVKYKMGRESTLQDYKDLGLIVEEGLVNGSE